MDDNCTCCGAKMEYVSTLTFKRRRATTLRNYLTGSRAKSNPRNREAQPPRAYTHPTSFDGLCDDCVARVVETIHTMQASIRPWVGKI